MNNNLNENIFNVLNDKRIKINNIVEIGSRDGYDCYYLQNKFNILNENIYTFEPNDIQYKKIIEKFPNYNNFNFCISDKNEKRKFYSVKKTPGLSTLLKRSDGYKYDYDIIEVNCVTGKYILDNIIKDIDLCKIDTEGFSVNVLESFDNLETIKIIVIEMEHETIWDKQKLYNDGVKILSKTHIKIWDNIKKGIKQSDSIWINKNYY
jgi:FkbM family methyltransferase